ncbi:MAG: hypothetical protein JO057_07015 [Chloroflexi bacterium]|nr:hypothetical protein [Chloroflexota bacterium]
MAPLAALLALSGSVGCSVLLGPDATPVPGAAATLTRSINTPIPTPVRTPSTEPIGSPGPARVAVALSPSPFSGTVAPPLSDADVAAVQNQVGQTVSTPDLTGIDDLLLDHVSLSTPQGGSVMDSADAASWLRDHAGPNIKVSQVTRGTQDVMLQVDTVGWPNKDPIQNGQVTFSLRRYDANGRQDESGGGDWKIDVIEAD